MIALHGFGQDGSLFSKVEAGLGSAYTILALDLPHHGQTDWRGEAAVPPETWKAILERLIEEAGYAANQAFALCGFSMGGRWALQGACQLGKRLERLWLFSPEGLVINWSYHLAIHTRLGRYYSPRLIEDPRPAVFLLSMLQRLQILSTRRASFALRNLETKPVRELVWKAWKAMSLLRIDTRRLAAQLNADSVPVELIHGRRDAILPPRACRRFAGRLDQARFHEPDLGHFVIRPEINPLLKSLSADCEGAVKHST